jgi:hypothetical protein
MAGVIAAWLPNVLELRAIGHSAHGNHDKAVIDISLSISLHCVMRAQYAFLGKVPLGDLPIAASSQDDFSAAMANLLVQRSSYARDAKDINGMFCDLRAACVHEHGLHIPHEEMRVLPMYIDALAATRIAAQRPVFDKRERDQLFLECRVAEFSDARYMCHACTAIASSTVTLTRCAGCRMVWFCSDNCQATSWSKSHKAECSSLWTLLARTSRSFLASFKGYVEDTIERQGFIMLPPSSMGILVAFKDMDTGVIFDGISNEDIIFVEDDAMSSAIDTLAAGGVVNGIPSESRAASKVLPSQGSTGS